MKSLLPKLFHKDSSKGFTLIELLVALTILVILAVSVYVALNPAQRLKDAKDARRSSDVDSILTAIHQYIVDNKGSMPPNMPTVLQGEQQIGSSPTNATVCPAVVGTSCTGMATGCANLGADLPKYLASMPIDPAAGSIDLTNTGYSVKRDANGIVTVKACHTDGTTPIQASR